MSLDAKQSSQIVITACVHFTNPSEVPGLTIEILDNLKLHSVKNVITLRFLKQGTLNHGLRPALGVMYKRF